MRKAVAGYRLPSLQGELEAAREWLTAAGSAATIEVEPARLAPTADAVLAWAVREGVTNVIRHGRASRCAIRLGYVRGQVSIDIINEVLTGQEPAVALVSPGSGLTGLADRAAALGGRLEAGPIAVEEVASFRLRLELPEPNGVPVTAGQGA